MSETTVESGTTSVTPGSSPQSATGPATPFKLTRDAGAPSTTPPPDGGQQTPPAGTGETTFDKPYVEALRKEAGDYRTQNKTLQSELDALKAGQMSETERQIKQAQDTARQEAAADFGKRLAGAEFRAAAKEQGVDVKDVLEWVDLTKFVGKDGDVDSRAVESAVAKFAAIKQPQGTSFDGGARQSAPKPQDMNSFIRRTAGITE